MNESLNVPEKILSKLRLVCLDLPEVYEEQAWVGTRWCVKKKNFSHVLMIHQGWPPAYSKAAGTDGPACVLTFRFSAAKLEAPRFYRSPFFKPAWWPNIAGLVIQENVDWDEVGELLFQSYCEVAPKALVRLVEGR
ncbi:MmcQ/YjbR family DNA-binding protein [Leptospira barantonii]|uniref:MmcQ/YjbR family DNA-binding protein n=1 Tax=Leptospira barantonii TaxID=2023184 RepID=A0ABX4NML2_9LEPT|nr:MmcQ/YjbR family DNA-binding protein [Leptospira barantonii]PJZ58063.1 hypothetical protein CH367_06640 [Leptospira barantonii]